MGGRGRCCFRSSDGVRGRDNIVILMEGYSCQNIIVAASSSGFGTHCDDGADIKIEAGKTRKLLRYQGEYSRAEPQR